MNPPLRSAADRDAILDGLVDGTLEIISSDHAPHTEAEKEVEFDYAPFGIVGLETELSLSLMQLYHTGRLGLSAALCAMSGKEARDRPAGDSWRAGPGALNAWLLDVHLHDRIPVLRDRRERDQDAQHRAHCFVVLPTATKPHAVSSSR